MGKRIASTFLVSLLLLSSYYTIEWNSEVQDDLATVFENEFAVKTLSNSMVFSDIALGPLWNSTGDSNNVSSYLTPISPTEYFFVQHDVSTNLGIEIGVNNISTGLIWSQKRMIDFNSWKASRNNDSIILVGTSMSSGNQFIERILFNGTTAGIVSVNPSIDAVSSYGDKVVITGTFTGGVSFGTHSLNSRSGSNVAYSAYWKCGDVFVAVLENMTSWTMATNTVGGICSYNSGRTVWNSPSVEMTSDTIVVHVKTSSSNMQGGGSFSGCNAQSGKVFISSLNSSSGVCKFASDVEFSSNSFSYDELPIIFSQNESATILFEALHPRVLWNNGTETFLNNSNVANSRNNAVVSDVECQSNFCWVIGLLNSNLQLNGSTYYATNGNKVMFVGKYNLTAEKWEFFMTAGGQSSDEGIGVAPILHGAIFSARVSPPATFGNAITINSGSSNQPITGRIVMDSDLDTYHDVIDNFPHINSQWEDWDGDGYGDNSQGNLPDSCPQVPGNSTIDRYGCADYDGDGTSNLNDAFAGDKSQSSDRDFDGYGDNISGFRGDYCPDVFGTSDRDYYGCLDEDGDGYSNISDVFPSDPSQVRDSDDDGYGDNLIGVQGDACKEEFGSSHIDRYGCPDDDLDGVSNLGDDFPLDSTQFRDSDGDGYGDNESGNLPDAFPLDATQWNDSDGDGYGDNAFGNQGDKFPNESEYWSDIDDDGYPDEIDDFPYDGTQYSDADGDTYGDSEFGNRADACVEEWGTSTHDRYGCPDADSDGFSDENDAFPNDQWRWQDSDRDGIDDASDEFPFDPSQWNDSDGDGFGDNSRGTGADRFPDDASQWADIDGDGYGDNATGTNPDAFITDPTQWADSDGDGYGDNPAGRLADLFPNDANEWSDEDGDGIGDNSDEYLNDFDNDGYNDSIDPLPKLASPGDLDNDGCLDEDDDFPDDYRECFDFDMDGEGDNADTDDDGDGWADTDELRLGTDPFSSGEKPVESFEIVLPGTTIGLGAWDLIGIFGGVPLFAWIGVGLVTRQAKTRRYEDELHSASSAEELFDIASRYERSLMWRMIGPHQALRLERIRTEIERDRFHISEEKSFPQILSTPEISLQATSFDESYEWVDYEGGKWYRVIGSGSEWIEWQ